MPVAFSESQRLRTWWIWCLVGGVAVLAWVGWFVQVVLGRPFGNNPGPDWLLWLLLALIGVGLPLFLAGLRLVSEVRDGTLCWRMLPFVRRRLPVGDIASVEARTYRPLREY